MSKLADFADDLRLQPHEYKARKLAPVFDDLDSLQDVDANAPGYDVAGILKTGALNRYYRRKATVDSVYAGPERRETYTPPKGNGKLAPDAYDNLDSLEF